MTLLDVRNLQVDFGAQPVVQGVSFQLAAGEKLALVGESGSGKTVTALSLLGLAAGARVQGQALLAGRDLLTLSESDLRGVRGGDVAMVFQEPMTALNPLMTIGAQIAEIFKLKRGFTPANSASAAIEMLASTGLADPAAKARAYPHQLSGGQRQRAVIAMALASEPKLLLADEPTTALDVSLRGQMLDLLTDLQRRHGMAVLLITHDLHLVRAFADRVAVMERGQVVEQGRVDSVFAKPSHPYTRMLLDSRPQRDALATALPPPTGTPVVLEANQLGVAYPVRLPGWRGWF
jgi:microcin C transport system ATP-binding protein